MTRLPELERALAEAARRADARPLLPRRSRVRFAAPASVAALAVAGVAFVASSHHGDTEIEANAPVGSALAIGAPVPPTPDKPMVPEGSNAKLKLASVRTKDPDGGLPWGVATYVARSLHVPKGTPANIAAQFGKPLRCVIAGRVQGGMLGVIGRDGVFADDGRLHALSPYVETMGGCAGEERPGWLETDVSLSSMPASGYGGRPGPPLGGCRERVDLNGPTVSPQTRRRLRNVPECAKGSLRRIVMGFAGPRASSATLTATGYRKTITLDRSQSGPYIFVLRNDVKDANLVLRDQAGHVCEPLNPTPAPSGLNRFADDGCRLLLHP